MNTLNLSNKIVDREKLSEMVGDLWDRQMERLDSLGATVVKTLDSGTAVFISYVTDEDEHYEVMIPKSGGTASEGDLDIFNAASPGAE